MKMKRRKKKNRNSIGEVEAYCVKCKRKRLMENPKQMTMKNGRKAVKGTCPKCGSGMFRIGG